MLPFSLGTGHRGWQEAWAQIYCFALHQWPSQTLAGSFCWCHGLFSPADGHQQWAGLALLCWCCHGVVTFGLAGKFEGSLWMTLPHPIPPHILNVLLSKCVFALIATHYISYHLSIIRILVIGDLKLITDMNETHTDQLLLISCRIGLEARGC